MAFPSVPGPTEYSTHVDRSVEDVQEGNLPAAVYELTQAINKAPATIGSRPDLMADLYWRRGACLYSMHYATVALKDCDRALQLDGRSSPAHYYRSVCLERLSQFGAALKELEALSHLDHGIRAISDLNSIAWLEATCPDAKVRNGKAAVALATRACELDHWRDAPLIWIRSPPRTPRLEISAKPSSSSSVRLTILGDRRSARITKGDLRCT